MQITTNSEGKYTFNDFLSIYSIYISANNLYYEFYQNESARLVITIYRKNDDSVYTGTFDVFVIGYKIGT